MGNNFDRINKETQNINTTPKSNSNESEIFKSNGTKIEEKHPVYATKHNKQDKNNKNMNQDKNKKASDDKTTYSSVRITTDTSERLHALLTASGYSNRDELIRDMIHFAEPILLNNREKHNKYKKAYKVYKIQKKQKKELKKL